MTTLPAPALRARCRLRVRGVVQGVGFRPAIYRLAGQRGLAGFVRNETDGVVIEVEGDGAAVTSFVELVRTHAPDGARIDAIETGTLPPLGEEGFRIETSTGAPGRGELPADRATCDACLREMFDPADRRFRYPFITCTACGPRFTIIRDLPYDRARTTMDRFAMCEACLSEYEDPADRRFHAETNACSACGPRLVVADPSGRDVRSPLDAAIAALRAGRIVAVKGIGGFHLAVDAANDEAVRRLRERKQRPDKPFAVMVRDLAAAERIAVVGDAAREALISAARPIVCVPTRPSAVAPSVAPRLDEIGIMLPYSPLHHLLLHDGPKVLVMTSGNRRDEPVAIDDGAIAQLADIADAFLLHDRPIHRRADDSVVRVVATTSQLVRRSRGIVPEAIALPFDAPDVLAAGAELKSTIAVTRGRSVYLSPHIGDLSHPETLRFFEESIAAATELFGVAPVAVAHDLHPDYASTRWALRANLPRVGVQHHHAHIASCMAEHGRTDALIGVAFDGTGCGPAGDLWGGEILIASLGGFERAGYLRPIALPGGEAAIREPWRLAAAALLDAGEPLDLFERVAPNRLANIETLLRRGINAPVTTSAGRWFDAVAALCGIRDAITFEAQAAMEMEAIAADEGDPYEFVIDKGEIDLRPAVRTIAGEVRSGVPAAIISAQFHETLARAVALFIERIAPPDLRTVALSGGCFQNRRLTERTQTLLESAGFEVLIHRRVPPNDGGIALGQAAVAAWRLASVRE